MVNRSVDCSSRSGGEARNAAGSAEVSGQAREARRGAAGNAPTPLEREQALTIHDLRLRLEDAEDVLAAIRRGEVDALVVKSGAAPQIWSLNGVDQVYRVLFETLNEGALTLDAGGAILFSNTQFAALLGRGVPEVLGTRFADHVAPADQAVFEMLLKKGLRRRSKGELTLLDAQASPVPVQLSLSAVEVEKVGRTVTMVVSDLTELKRVQAALAEVNDALEARVAARTAELQAEVAERQRLTEQLEEADRRKNEFLAMLGHELRNPLAPISNAVEKLRLCSASPPAVESARAVIERQLKHLARLVDDLLDVARITRGSVELRRERVDVAAAVEASVNACRAPFEAVSQALVLSLPDEPCWIEGDATRIEQVVTNLISNAGKYTPPGGHVWVTLERRGDWAELSVRDDGRGIPREKLAAIFDLFTQVDTTLDRASGGLGIGLTVVRKLVALHGGSVTANSEGPGRGSEFRVRLPLLPRAVSAAAEPPKRLDGQVRPLRILIVEDNVDSAETLADLVAIWGHQVRIADHGEAALRILAEFEPQVVILDIGLPGEDGYAVARRLRKRLRGAPVTLIALTGYGQEEDRRRALAAGFDLHLTKPIEAAELRQILGNASRAANRHGPGLARAGSSPSHSTE